MNPVKFCLPLLLLFAQCHSGNENNIKDEKPKVEKPKEPIEIKYSAFSIKKGRGDSIKKYYTPQQFSIILALNRIDSAHINSPDTLIIPDNFEAELIQYSPFPVSLSFLSEVKKIIFFSYSSQSFAVYNSGVLVHWGPTNMGSKKHPTPTGIYYANWKAEETKSSFDDEWILKWNVNLDNKEGVGWHQYTLPGFPASHSCLRLLEADAKFLYDWVDEWKLVDKENIETNGTPTVIFGAYPFGKPKPWLALLQNAHILDINEDLLKKEVAPFLADIKHWEQKRDSVNAAK